MRNVNDRSLRRQVEKWLAPASATPVRVTEFGRTRLGRRRYVRAETSSADGVRELFFFRHDDGSWCVFPPTTASLRPTPEPPVAQVAAACSAQGPSPPRGHLI
ncbi:hypothetical protein [Paraburkholderia franconis]|uniref:hypothetical protein n=1 Tax=Paraburkholderia franconis TaxID=2654983 RepID=UPI001D10FC48|nr:hypothetical protein [Paraburkholderia franconis]